MKPKILRFSCGLKYKLKITKKDIELIKDYENERLISNYLITLDEKSIKVFKKAIKIFEDLNKNEK